MHRGQAPVHPVVWPPGPSTPTLFELANNRPPAPKLVQSAPIVTLPSSPPTAIPQLQPTIQPLSTPAKILSVVSVTDTHAGSAISVLKTFPPELISHVPVQNCWSYWCHRDAGGGGGGGKVRALAADDGLVSNMTAYRTQQCATLCNSHHSIACIVSQTTQAGVQLG